MHGIQSRRQRSQPFQRQNKWLAKLVTFSFLTYDI